MCFFCVDVLKVLVVCFCIHKLLISHLVEHPLDGYCFMGASIKDAFFKEHFSSPSNRNDLKAHLLYSASTLLGVLVSHVPFAAFKNGLNCFYYFSIISSGF